MRVVPRISRQRRPLRNGQAPRANPPPITDTERNQSYATASAGQPQLVQSARARLARDCTYRATARRAPALAQRGKRPETGLRNVIISVYVYAALCPPCRHARQTVDLDNRLSHSVIVSCLVSRAVFARDVQTRARLRRDDETNPLRKVTIGHLARRAEHRRATLGKAAGQTPRSGHATKVA
jgi:hypothetical protein